MITLSQIKDHSTWDNLTEHEVIVLNALLIKSKTREELTSQAEYVYLTALGNVRNEGLQNLGGKV